MVRSGKSVSKDWGGLVGGLWRVWVKGVVLWESDAVVMMVAVLSVIKICREGFSEIMLEILDDRRELIIEDGVEVVEGLWRL